MLSDSNLKMARVNQTFREELLSLAEVVVGVVFSLQVYTKALYGIYASEVASFLEAVKYRISPQTLKHGSTLSRLPGGTHGSSESLQSIDPRHQPADKKGRQNFDQVLTDLTSWAIV